MYLSVLVKLLLYVLIRSHWGVAFIICLVVLFFACFASKCLICLGLQLPLSSACWPLTAVLWAQLLLNGDWKESFNIAHKINFNIINFRLYPKNVIYPVSKWVELSIKMMTKNSRFRLVIIINFIPDNILMFCVQWLTVVLSAPWFIYLYICLLMVIWQQAVLIH